MAAGVGLGRLRQRHEVVALRGERRLAQGEKIKKKMSNIKLSDRSKSNNTMTKYIQFSFAFASTFTHHLLESILDLAGHCEFFFF